MLAENTESGESKDSPKEDSKKRKAWNYMKEKERKAWNYMKEKEYNRPWEILPKLAFATIGFWVSSIFLKGSIFLWVAWFIFGLIFLKAVLWMLPVPIEWKETIAKIFKFILVLAIVFFGVSLLWTGFQTGGYKELLIGVEETGAEKAVGTTWEKIWGSILHPGRIGDEFSDWDNVKTVEENIKKGIEFFDLRTRRPWFEEETEIILYGSAKITALPQTDTKVTFGCKIDEEDAKDVGSKDYNPKGKLTLRGLEGNTVDVFAGHDVEVSFECILNGIPLNLSDDLRKDKEEDSRTFVSIVEGIYYDFTTTTVLGVYNIKKEEYDKLTDPEDSIPDKGLNGKISSECFEGCGLTTVPLTTVPLIQTEVGSNLLRVILKRDSDWYGNIDRVSKIDVNMPNNFRLINCEDFGGDSILDESDPYLDVLNKNLKDERYEYSGGREFSFYCDYNVVEPRNFLGKSDIIVASTYDYKVEGKEAIKIIEKRIEGYGSGNIADPETGSEFGEDNGEGDTRYYYA